MSTRVTRQQLEEYIDQLNDCYCKGTPYELSPVYNYGGVCLGMFPKKKKLKNGKVKYASNYLSGWGTDITHGYVSNGETLEKIYDLVYSGSLKERIDRMCKYEKKKKREDKKREKLQMGQTNNAKKR